MECFFSGGLESSGVEAPVSTTKNCAENSLWVLHWVLVVEPVALLNLNESFLQALELAFAALDLVEEIVQLNLLFEERDLVEGCILQDGGEELLLGAGIQLGFWLDYPADCWLRCIVLLLDLLLITSHFRVFLLLGRNGVFFLLLMLTVAIWLLLLQEGSGFGDFQVQIVTRSIPFILEELKWLRPYFRALELSGVPDAFPVSMLTGKPRE